MNEQVIVIGAIKITIAEEKPSVIGRTIKIHDNSYSRRTDVRNDSHCDLIGCEMVIISEPFQKQVHKGWELREWGESYETMVHVFSPVTGFTYEVMFQEGWLV